MYGSRSDYSGVEPKSLSVSKLLKVPPPVLGRDTFRNTLVDNGLSYTANLPATVRGPLPLTRVCSPCR